MNKIAKKFRRRRQAPLPRIERLFLEGHRNGEIAVMLDSTALVVARNLREIKKRWTREPPGSGTS